MSTALDMYKALGDEVRLRIVRALGVAELSVAELVTVLDSPQSTVSRHLKPLRDTMLVEARREGTTVYYRRGAKFEDRDFSRVLDAQIEELPGSARDQAMIRQIMDLRRKRSREFFDRMAGCYHQLTEPGGGWPVLAAALAAGFSGRQVVDVGAGEGWLTITLARFAREVVAVDYSPEMLRVIEERASDEKLADRIRTVEGDLEHLPLDNDGYDAVFLSQSLHHASLPQRAVAEAARVLRTQGCLIVLDLVRHQQEWVRDQLADQWLGFEEHEVMAWMHQTGLTPSHAHVLQGAAPELSILLMTGRKMNE